MALRLLLSGDQKEQSTVGLPVRNGRFRPEGLCATV